MDKGQNLSDRRQHVFVVNKVHRFANRAQRPMHVCYLSSQRTVHVDARSPARAENDGNSLSTAAFRLARACRRPCKDVSYFAGLRSR